MDPQVLSGGGTSSRKDYVNTAMSSGITCETEQLNDGADNHVLAGARWEGTRNWYCGDDAPYAPVFSNRCGFFLNVGKQACDDFKVVDASGSEVRRNLPWEQAGLSASDFGFKSVSHVGFAECPVTVSHVGLRSVLLYPICGVACRICGVSLFGHMICGVSLFGYAFVLRRVVDSGQTFL